MNSAPIRFSDAEMLSNDITSMIILDGMLQIIYKSVQTSQYDPRPFWNGLLTSYVHRETDIKKYMDSHPHSFNCVIKDKEYRCIRVNGINPLSNFAKLKGNVSDVQAQDRILGGMNYFEEVICKIEAI